MRSKELKIYSSAEACLPETFWCVDSASGYDHVGSGTMPDPVETLLWDYNRYDVLAEKAFDLSGYQALGELMSLGVEPHSSLVNADLFETAVG